ncbi:PilW family protein [Salinisphaera sp. Q1T1-3]|uniref:PilW family protein n=1 Tax=Salinisphaera sp. Q1T1-3 TaxID=2321229 RepID=UPI001314DA0E|nr:PilW family protein [Salinisphaera sp. Q1T1-3]
MTRRSTISGFSLVELMVAMTIGLLLLAGVLQIMLSNRQSFDAQEATSRVQENLRLAEFVLSHSIAHAGFHVPLNVRAADIFPSMPGKPGLAAGAVVADQPDTHGYDDTLRIRYKSGGGIRDCRGKDIGRTTDIETADFEFYINNNNSLICHVIGGDRQPIAENVDAFEVTYGLDSDKTPGVDRFVASLSAGQAVQVRSIRIQLLLSSEYGKTPLAANIERTFTFADGSITTFDDRRIHMLLDETIALPNLIPD